jgi:hypothetical protein
VIGEHRAPLAVLVVIDLAARGGPQPPLERSSSTMPPTTTIQNSGTKTIHQPGPSWCQASAKIIVDSVCMVVTPF